MASYKPYLSETSLMKTGGNTYYHNKSENFVGTVNNLSLMDNLRVFAARNVNRAADRIKSIATKHKKETNKIDKELRKVGSSVENVLDILNKEIVNDSFLNSFRTTGGAKRTDEKRYGDIYSDLKKVSDTMLAMFEINPELYSYNKTNSSPNAIMSAYERVNTILEDNRDLVSRVKENKKLVNSQLFREQNRYRGILLEPVIANYMNGKLSKILPDTKVQNTGQFAKIEDIRVTSSESIDFGVDVKLSKNYTNYRTYGLVSDPRLPELNNEVYRYMVSNIVFLKHIGDDTSKDFKSLQSEVMDYLKSITLTFSLMDADKDSSFQEAFNSSGANIFLATPEGFTLKYKFFENIYKNISKIGDHNSVNLDSPKKITSVGSISFKKLSLNRNEVAALRWRKHNVGKGKDSPGYQAIAGDKNGFIPDYRRSKGFTNVQTTFSKIQNEINSMTFNFNLRIKI